MHHLWGRSKDSLFGLGHVLHWLLGLGDGNKEYDGEVLWLHISKE